MEKIHIELNAEQIRIILPLWRDLKEKAAKYERAAGLANGRLKASEDARDLFWDTANKMFPVLKGGHSHFHEDQKVFENGPCDCGKNIADMIYRRLRNIHDTEE